MSIYENSEIETVKKEVRQAIENSYTTLTFIDELHFLFEKYEKYKDLILCQILESDLKETVKSATLSVYNEKFEIKESTINVILSSDKIETKIKNFLLERTLYKEDKEIDKSTLITVINSNLEGRTKRWILLKYLKTNLNEVDYDVLSYLRKSDLDQRIKNMYEITFQKTANRVEAKKMRSENDRKNEKIKNYPGNS